MDGATLSFSKTGTRLGAVLSNGTYIWSTQSGVLFIIYRTYMCNFKQLLDEVFVISRIINVEVGVISRSRRLRLISFTKSHAFAPSLTASITKCANLKWLPLKIMHRGHTWHYYPWPWVSLTWLLYNLQLDDVTGDDFENSLYVFGQSEKR